jgi:site-specific recombinase XerD
MASLSKEKSGIYRIHWRFKVRVGPRASEKLQGSLQLGRCTRAAAKAKLREIDEWQERVKTGRHVPDRDFDGVCAAWFRERELTCTPQTLDRTRRVITLHKRWRNKRGLPGTVADVASRIDLVAWRDHRLDGEAGRKTVANDLSTLSAFFEWCVREKYLPDNPMERIARPQFVSHKEGTPLTREQAGRWLRSIRPRQGRNGQGPRSWDEVRRKRQLIVFFLNTGLRNGQLCSMSVEDLRVDDEEQLIYVMGKGLKERWVPLNRAALAAARLHLRTRRNPRTGLLFVTHAGGRYNVRQLASEIAGTLYVRDLDVQVNPHNLRHTFATWLVRSVLDVSLVQKILGHENVNTTLKYYVHTADHELAGATASLRGRRNDENARSPKRGDDFRIIPFPQRQVS